MNISLIRRLRPFQMGALTLTSLFFVLGLSLPIPFGWYSPEMSARVVAEDGTPVAGAIVVASWNIAGPWNGASLGQLELQEVLTDVNGKFTIPAWGPRFLSKGGIRQDEPVVRIFKTGFSPRIIWNFEEVPMNGADKIIVFRLQNQDIELTPFKGDLLAYEAELEKFNDGLRDLIYSDPRKCYWKKIPHVLLALQDIKLELDKIGGGRGQMWLAYQFAGMNQPQCGDAKQFFLDYRNEYK